MLENEIKLFEQKLPEMLQDREGQYVLIQSEEISFFDDYTDAVNVGLEKYGPTDGFLVRQVLTEQPKYIIPTIFLRPIYPDIARLSGGKVQMEFNFDRGEKSNTN